MRQQLKIARLTPAVLIGVCHPAAALLLSAPSGLLGGPAQSGPPGEVWHGSSGDQPSTPSFQRANVALVNYSFSHSANSRCASSDSDIEFRAVGERHMNNYHVICLGERGTELGEVGGWAEPP